MTQPLTLRDAMNRAGNTLAVAGVPAPRLEARLILAHVLGTGCETVVGHPERRLSARQREVFDGLIDRRINREPLAYLTGQREFWSLPFFVTRETLIPRPDSETIIETALWRIDRRRRDLRILDLGTGSGCLLMALLSELPESTGLGIDRSWDALRVATRNAKMLGLAERTQFVCGHWSNGLAGRFDLVVANPPYIAAGDIPELAPEITRYEPRLALDGGDDGLCAYRAIAPDLPRVLVPNGALIFEVGAGQASSVVAMLRKAGFQHLEINGDLSGNPRCVSGFLGQFRKEKKRLETNRFPSSFSKMGGPGIAGCRARGRRQSSKFSTLSPNRAGIRARRGLSKRLGERRRHQPDEGEQ